MTGFFARSLTGIKYLVGDQYKEVQLETGKEPKVSLFIRKHKENTKHTKYLENIENPSCRRSWEF
jgi:hypothetical protein